MSRMMLNQVLMMLMGVCVVFAGGGGQDLFLQQETSEVQAFESVPASEVEYVDGPLVPLYDFLIQKRLHKFCKLLREAALEDVLQGLGGSMTLFVPTDASFVFMSGEFLKMMKRDPQKLRDFILYHFVTDDFTTSQILNEMIVDSVQGAPLRFNVYGQLITVSGAQIVEPDLEFDLGRIHIIDHPLDRIPTTDTITYLRKNHQNFYKLLVDADLVDYLSIGTFTILVPVGDAFDYLSDELNRALQNNRTLAERVLLNHILPGSIYSGGITDGMQWETVGGAIITFTTKRGIIFANDIPILEADIPFTNGVIHAVARVILPEGVEADCQCKASSNKLATQTTPQRTGSSRVPAAQTPRPSFTQGLTTRLPNDQSFQRQTPGSFVQNRPSPFMTSRQRTPIQQPTRARQTPRPIPPPLQITRSPFDQPAIQPQPEDDINSVVPPLPPNSGQKRPDQTRTTRYPPPARRVPPPPAPRTPVQPPRSQPPQAPDNDINLDQELAPVVTNPPRQTSWNNRQPSQATRYPPAPRGSFRTTTTTRRPQSPRTNIRIAPPPVVGKVPQRPVSEIILPTSSPLQEIQTQRPISSPSWQQQNQITRQVPQPRTTRPPARIPPPPNRRPVQPRPGSFPTPVPILPGETDQPFESNRQCRRRGDRLIPSNQNLPVCPDSETQEPCQNEPYNPSDLRPLCPTNSVIPGCRSPNEPFNPSDRRPMCPTPPPVPGQGCRMQGQATYVGDRRPLCSPSPPVQTGCRDPSAPFTPSDNRPPCATSAPITPIQRVVQPQGCRNLDEPQDGRPLCPGAPQEDCRPFLERPKAGDRRPICRTNQPPSQQGQRPGKVPPSQQRNTYPQSTRSPNTQTTRRQTWQQTTPRPQDTTNQIANTGQPQIGKVPQINIRPQSPPSQPQRGTFQMQQQPSPRQPQPNPRQPQPNPRQPQSNPRQPQPNPRQPQPNPRQPQPNPRQPQPSPIQPQTNPRQPQQNTRQPQPVSRQPQPTFQQPQPGSVSQPQIGNLGQPETGFQPSTQGSFSPRPSSITPQTPSRPNFVPRPTPPNPRSQSQGPFPQVIATQSPPLSQPIRTTNQPIRTTISGVIPGIGQQQRRPISPPRQQAGSITSFPGRVTSTTRIPVSVTGTSTAPEEDSRRTLYEIVEDPALLIRGRPVKLTKIFDLFHKAGLDDILLGPGPTTVFLPSDDAFATLPKGVVDQLEENPELLRQVLLYHVASVEILPSAQGESYTVPSMAGDQLVITMLNQGRLILISGAKAIAVTRANNGIFYVINQLLYPLPHKDIVGAIQSRPDLSILSLLLPQSGLTDMLQGQTPYTFLAPTDNAFAQLPAAVYDELTQNTTALQEILLNHIIEGAHYGREFLTGGTFPSARGGKLKFQVVSYGYQVNEINIKTPEIVTGTGVIHLIDQIILEDSDKKYFKKFDNSVEGQDGTPPNNQPALEFQPFVQPPQQNPGQRPGFAQPQAGQRTPQAPSLPTGLQPPANGQWNGQRISSGQRTTTLRPSNGQPQNNIAGRHTNPSVQSPGQPGHSSRRPTTGGQMALTGQRGAVLQPQILPAGENGQQANVADLAKAMGLNRFADWVTNTGLLEKIHDGGVYTVFAPTDDAVGSLPEDMVNSIDSNPDQTRSLLQYHIVPQRLNINSLRNEETANTLLQGKSIRFNVYQTAQASCKQLVTASGTPIGDSLATMGSIQMIPVTQVLYQPTGSLQNIIDASPILKQLSQAVRAARLTWVITGTGPLTFFAPSDTAFQALSPEEKKSLIDDKQAFTELLKRHLVRGTYFSSGAQEDIQKNNENNQPMTISLQDGVLTVNSVPVTFSDITATNGVLHVIDRFL